MSDSDRHINFKLMRDHILATQDGKDSRTGKQYWRSLEELADSPSILRDWLIRVEAAKSKAQSEGFLSRFWKRGT